MYCHVMISYFRSVRILKKRYQMDELNNLFF